MRTNRHNDRLSAFLRASPLQKQLAWVILQVLLVNYDWPGSQGSKKMHTEDCSSKACCSHNDCVSVDWQTEGGETWQAFVWNVSLQAAWKKLWVYCLLPLAAWQEKLIPIIVGCSRIFNTFSAEQTTLRGCFCVCVFFCHIFIPRVHHCNRFKLLFSSTNSFLDFAHFQSELWNENVCWRLEWSLCWEVFKTSVSTTLNKAFNLGAITPGSKCWEVY